MGIHLRKQDWPQKFQADRFNVLLLTLFSCSFLCIASKAHTNFISWAGFYRKETWFSFGLHFNKCFSLGPKNFGLKHCRPRMALEQAKPEWPVTAATKQEIFKAFLSSLQANEAHSRWTWEVSKGVPTLCCPSQTKWSKTKGTGHNDATGSN